MGFVTNALGNFVAFYLFIMGIYLVMIFVMWFFQALPRGFLVAITVALTLAYGLYSWAYWSTERRRAETAARHGYNFATGLPAVVHEGPPIPHHQYPRNPGADLAVPFPWQEAPTYPAVGHVSDAEIARIIEKFQLQG